MLEALLNHFGLGNFLKRLYVGIATNIDMSKNELLSRITINPEQCHGKPCIRGMRYTVASILEYLAAGDSIEDILAVFPDLESEDILACLAFAALAVNTKGSLVFPIAA